MRAESEILKTYFLQTKLKMAYFEKDILSRLKAIFLVTIVFWIFLTLTLQVDDEYFKDEKFNNWIEKQATLKQNIQRVCKKYGLSVKKIVPSHEFIFDSEHNILFCRNAKVLYN